MPDNTVQILKWSDVAPQKETAEKMLSLSDFVGKTVRFVGVGVGGRKEGTLFGLIDDYNGSAVKVKLPKGIAGKLGMIFKEHPGSVVEATVQKGERKVYLS